MQSIKLQERSSNPGRQAPTADDINAAKQRIQVAMEKACQLFDDLGGIDYLAVMFQADPLSAEFTFRDNFFDMDRKILGKTFENIDDFVSPLDVEKKKGKRAIPTQVNSVR